MNKHYISLATVLLFMGCQEKEELPFEGGGTEINVEITASIAGHIGIQTKANTESDGTQWNNNDKIAIRNTATADYFTYVYQNKKWGPDGNEYLKWPGEEMDIAAYYPAEAREGNFDLPADQSDTLKLRSADFMSTATLDNEGIHYPDTLVARIDKGYAINLTMYHRMTKVILNFTSKKSISDLTVNSAYAGFANNEPNGSVTPIIPQERQNLTTKGQTFTAIVVPDENGKNDADFLILKEKGVTYTLKGIPAMKAGYEYTFSVMFSDEKKLSIINVTVQPWKDMIHVGEGASTVMTYSKRGFWEPSALYDGGLFYLVCSEAKIPGYSFQPGLQVFVSSDLKSFTRQENILGDVLTNWGIAKYKEEAAKAKVTVDESAIYIGYPQLVKINNVYYILYMIQDDVNPISVMGLAYTNSLDQPWIDGGYQRTSFTNKLGPAHRSLSSNVHYNSSDKQLTVSFLEGGNNGDVRWWRHRCSISGGKLTLASNKYCSIAKNPANVTNPEMFPYNSKFHYFYSNTGYSYFHLVSDLGYSAMPKDYNGTNFNGGNGLNVMTAYCINGGNIWKNIGGLTAFEGKDGKWYVVHQAFTDDSPNKAQLQIRSLHWISPNFTGATYDAPAICPEPYSDADNNPVTKADIPGTWYFGNLTQIKDAHSYNNIKDKLILKADGTASLNETEGYSWTYNESFNMLTLKLKENIYLYVQGVTNHDSGKVTFAASGITGNSNNSSYWMEKE